jgi:hypothetical protein
MKVLIRDIRMRQCYHERQPRYSQGREEDRLPSNPLPILLVRFPRRLRLLRRRPVACSLKCWFRRMIGVSEIGRATNTSLTPVTRSVGRGVRLGCREGLKGFGVYVINIPGEEDQGRYISSKVHDERFMGNRRCFLWPDSSIPPLFRCATKDEAIVIFH